MGSFFLVPKLLLGNVLGIKALLCFVLPGVIVMDLKE
jgi:hypothetical protein